MKRALLIALALLLSATAVAAREGRFIASPCGYCGGAAAHWTVTLDASVADTALTAFELSGRYGGQVRVIWPGDDRRFTIDATVDEAHHCLADPRVLLVDGRPGKVSASRMSRSSRKLAAGAEAAGDTWTTGIYQYDGAGNIKQIGDDVYRYDRVSRLATATVVYASGTTPDTYRQSFGFDPYGNPTAWTTTLNGVPQGSGPPVVDTTTNRYSDLTAYGYDNAGNQTKNGAMTFAYDPLNMPVEKVVTLGKRTRYIYNADNERIAAINLDSGETHWTLRGLDQKVLTEATGTSLAAPPVWTKDYIWGGATLLASKSQQGMLYYHSDHLGTPRLITDAGRNRVEEHKYLPFGVEITPQGNEVLKFTGHERDQGDFDSADLDCMHARYYNPNLGRFLSVDPVLESEKALKQPQRWNRYSYVENNPINKVDPNGRCSAFVALGLLPLCGTLDLIDYARSRGGDVVEAAQGMGRSASTQENLMGAAVIGIVAADVLSNAAVPEEGAVKGGLASVRTGQLGEALAGIREGIQKERIPIPGTLRMRIPDELTSGSLREIKNVAYQARTLQLQDFLKYAQQAKIQFILEVRESTVISKPLQRLIDDGLIELRRTLPK